MQIVVYCILLLLLVKYYASGEINVILILSIVFPNGDTDMQLPELKC